MTFSNTDRGKKFIGVSAVALVHDGQGKLLLQKRGKNARDERGNWDLCGGAVDFGETIIRTIERELLEELCTAPIRMNFLTVYDAFREIDAQPTHWIAVVYAVAVDPKTVSIGEPDKIEELGWFNDAELPSPLHSQFQKSYQVARQAGIIR
jgi:8-oxo-dGTP diphosphatase